MFVNNRKVVDVEVDGVDPNDYPDFSDAYFSRAMFEDTGEELNELEMELLTQAYPDVLGEMAFEYYQ